VPAPMLKPKIVRITKAGRIDRVALKGADAPDGDTAIGLTFHDGWLYFSHEQKDGTFNIDRVRPAGGDVEVVVRGMPTLGDHDVNHLLFDGQGTLWFGVGSATNSGVVAADDPVNQKWLKAHPDAHDIPCRDLHLTGQKFTDARGVTGAYQALGHADAATIAAQPMCTSAIYRLAAGTSAPELVAWGFRNPVALAFDGDSLLVGMQGADVRSTRPIADDPDTILRVRQGAWYGWPDYDAALRPHTIPAVIDHAASGLAAPDRSLLVATVEPHAAISGMWMTADGKLLAAEMGDFKPMTAPDSGRAGFQVEQIDPRSGAVTAYARNRNDGDPQPASTLDLRNAFERPVDVRIGPDGRVYVLDFGAFVVTGGAPKAFPKTGKVFALERARD
jgi:glucose/arabinose dehydrogenase